MLRDIHCLFQMNIQFGMDDVASKFVIECIRNGHDVNG
jgi:hypothetical protein